MKKGFFHAEHSKKKEATTATQLYGWLISTVIITGLIFVIVSVFFSNNLFHFKDLIPK